MAHYNIKSQQKGNQKTNSNPSTNNHKHDKNQSACFNPSYCIEWNIPQHDNLVNVQGYPLPSLIEKFSLPEYDECMSMHQCAITKKIPLNGTLYVYNSRICFFSRYNADTLIGKATIVSIPLSDVASVFKKKTGFIFDQGIELQLKNHQYFFFSAFKDRDQAYNYMTELLSWQKRLQPTAEDLNIECIRQELQNLKQQIEQSQIKQKDRKKIFSNQPGLNGNKKPPSNNDEENDLGENIIEVSDDEEEWEEVKTVEEMEKKKDVEQQWNQHIDKLTLLYEHRVQKLRNAVLTHFEVSTKAKWTSINIKNISAKEVYILFFGNNVFEDEKQQAYSNFGIYYNTHVLNELDMNYSDIVPEPPLYYTNLYDNNKLEIIDFPEYSTRKCTFTHLIKEAFMPKSCECFIEEKIYWVSPKEILIERELSFQGIPLSTHFNPRVIYQITESTDSLNQTQTQIRSGYYIHYVKDTWFKSKIEKTSDEENMKNWDKISLLYIKYSDLWVNRREQGLQLQKKQSAVQNNKDNKDQSNKIPDLQNNDSHDVEIIQSEDIDPEDKQIADIADASQSICSIF